ncbi:MAG: hypothetical protein ACR2LS_05280 [Thermomicrobiales bacterium]|jgi:hypothetical protein
MLRTTLALLGLLTIGLLVPSSAGAQEALDCAEFASQAEAQAAYWPDPSDPAGNDVDGDGLAGELPWQEEPTRIPITPFAGIPSFGAPTATP